MYGFAIALGLLIVVYGLYRGYKEDEPSFQDFDEIEYLSILEKRVEALENNWDILYSEYRNLLEMDSRDKESINLDIKENLELSKADKYEIFKEYKSNNYPLEKICKDLDLTKGEVLLLENLYRKLEK